MASVKTARAGGVHRAITVEGAIEEDTYAASALLGTPTDSMEECEGGRGSQPSSCCAAASIGSLVALADNVAYSRDHLHGPAERQQMEGRPLPLKRRAGAFCCGDNHDDDVCGDVDGE